MIWAADLRPDPDDLEQERWLAYGCSSTGAPLGEAWFVALRKARRRFAKFHQQLPEELVFEADEAARVAALPQMRDHVQIWRRQVGRRRQLPCGLPDRLQGMAVVVHDAVDATQHSRG